MSRFIIQNRDELRDRLEDVTPRDSRGRFSVLVCVNAHDRCYLGGPCPYCEVRERG